MENVFVYGTLMTGLENNFILSNSEFLGKAITADKYKMTARFIPFLSKEPLCSIFGEVYSVNDEVLERLDILEGHPRWYKREKIRVIIGNATIWAWCYLNEEKSSPLYTIVTSGNYYEYRFTNEKRRSSDTSKILSNKKDLSLKDIEIKELKRFK